MSVLIIDTSYLIYRSYFAYPNLTSNGLPTGAFYGFIKTILYLLQEYKPEELVFADDLPVATWRHEILADYKANRPEIEENMVSQIPMIKAWCQKITKNCFSKPSFEADDFIFTVASNLIGEESKILVFSSDRDLYQLLIYPEVKFIKSKTLKDEISLFGQDEFVEKYQLDPVQWLDYKALVGDASDNLKGVPGVGPKTATKILQEVGCLYNLFEALGQNTENFCKLDKLVNLAENFIANPKNQTLIAKLIENKQQIESTYHLATLQIVPETILSHTGYNLIAAIEDFEKHNFKSLITQISKISIEKVEPEALF